MDDLLAQAKDAKTLALLVVAQFVALAIFGVRAVIKIKELRAQRSVEHEFDTKKHERTTLDAVMAKLLQIEPTVVATKAELDLFRPYIMSIPKLQQDLATAFKLLKNGKGPEDPPKH